jgi:uncharacterized protein (UPF0332 family)
MTAPATLPPTAISWQNLINAGRDLLNPQRTGQPPTDEHIRRAISSAYYALFHALAASNADALIGAPQDRITAAAWSRVYRGLDHGTARRELQRYRQEFSTVSQIFADTFQDLQNRRHSADYDHNAVFTAQEGSVLLAESEAAINDYMRADRSERAYIAAVTLIRPR